MIDELTSGLALTDDELTFEDRSTSEGDTPQSRGQKAEQTGEAAPQRPNWFDDPEYRKIQAANDRLLAEYRKTAEEKEQQRLQLEAQLEDHATRNMDDFERAQWTATKYQRQLEAANARLAQMEQQQAAILRQQERDRDLAELSSKYEVPISALSEATTYKEAEVMAKYEAMRRRLEGDQAEAHRPDLGGGRASTPTTRKQADAEKAFKAGDTRAFFAALLD